MTRPLIVLAVVALIAVSGCTLPLPRLESDTSFLVDPNDAVLVEAVGEALAVWQPAVPFELSLQAEGGFQGGGWSVHRAKLGTPYGRTDPNTRAIKIDAPSRWLKVTVSHEIGHALGLDHDVGEACADGVMRVDARTVGDDNAAPSECELGLLAHTYGVELEAGSSDAPPVGAVPAVE